MGPKGVFLSVCAMVAGVKTWIYSLGVADGDCRWQLRVGGKSQMGVYGGLDL